MQAYDDPKSLRNGLKAYFEFYNKKQFHQSLEYRVPFREYYQHYSKIPIIRQIKHLVGILQREGEIKLVNKGNLPTAIVKELYPLGIGEYDIENGTSSLNKESDSKSVMLTNGLVKLMDIVKVNKNVMTLTDKGEKLILDNKILMDKLMINFCSGMDKSVFDNFKSEIIGNAGSGLIILLLNKYGNEKRPDKFYADKYFDQIPINHDLTANKYGVIDKSADACFSLRMFDHLLLQLGLVEIDRDIVSLKRRKDIVKTELFNKLISVDPPQKN